MRLPRRAVLLAAPALLAAARARAARAFEDAAGRRVVVPEVARRVFPAGPGAAVLVAAVAPDALLGWVSRPPDAALALLSPRLAALPALGRLTGQGPSADAATVQRAGADLVLDMGTVSRDYAAVADRVQAGSGVPAVLLDGALERTPALLRTTGALLGATARGEALARLAEALLADTAARLGALPPERRAMRVWVGNGDRALTFLPAESINAEGPALLGLRLPAGGGTRVADDAALLALDPEVALVPDRAAAAALRTDPAWQATTAGRTGRILAAPRLPFGWVEGPPSVQRLLGVRWLLAELHPDSLSPATARADAAALLAALFGAAPDDAALATILDAAPRR